MLEDAVLGIGEDDEDDGQPVVRGGPERLDAVHRRAVSREADHRALRHREIDAERAGDPLADAAAAAAEVVAVAAEAEGLGNLGAAGDRLLDDHHVLRHRRRQRLQHDRHRHGPPLAHVVEAGKPVPPFLLGEGGQHPVPLLGLGGVSLRAFRLHLGAERLQRRPQARDQARIEAVVAGEPLGRFLDVQHLGTGRERPFRRVPHLLEEGAAHHEHRVRPAEGRRDGGGIGGDAAAVVGMHIGHRLVLVDQLGPDAGAGRLGERDQGLARASACDIVADHDGGLARGQQEPGHGDDPIGIRRRRAVERAGGAGLHFGLLLHDVDRQRNEDRAGGRIVRDLEGAPHDGRDLVRALGLHAPLHHRRRHGHEVVAEDGIAQAQPRVLLAGGHHHGRVRAERAEDHADGVAEAGRHVQVHHTGAAAGLGVVARGPDGDALVQREHVLDPLIAREAVDQRALGGAGVAEHVLDPVRQQAFHEDVAPVHVSRPLLGNRPLRPEPLRRASCQKARRPAPRPAALSPPRRGGGGCARRPRRCRCRWRRGPGRPCRR